MPDHPEQHGYSKAEIDWKVGETRGLVARNDERLTRLEGCVFGNGKPSQKDQIMAEVKATFEHFKRNYRQDEADVIARIKDESMERKAQTQIIMDGQEKMKETMSKIVIKQTMIFAGIVVTLSVVKTLIDIGLLHVGK